MLFYCSLLLSLYLFYNVCFTYPFSIPHCINFFQEPIFVKVKILWPWRVLFLLELAVVFLLSLCSASSGLSEKSDNRCSCRWLQVCLVESMVSQSFSDHFSRMLLLSTVDFFLFSFFLSACDFFVLKTQLRNRGLYICKCYPELTQTQLNGLLSIGSGKHIQNKPKAIPLSRFLLCSL